MIDRWNNELSKNDKKIKKTLIVIEKKPLYNKMSQYVHIDKCLVYLSKYGYSNSGKVIMEYWNSHHKTYIEYDADFDNLCVIHWQYNIKQILLNGPWSAAAHKEHNPLTGTFWLPWLVKRAYIIYASHSGAHSSRIFHSFVTQRHGLVFACRWSCVTDYVSQ